MNALNEHVVTPASGSQPGHFGFATQGDAEETLFAETPGVSDDALREGAVRLLAEWEIIVPERTQTCLEQRLQKLAVRLKRSLEAARNNGTGRPAQGRPPLVRSRRVLENVLLGVQVHFKQLERLPHIHVPREGVLPRVINLAEQYLRLAGGIWSESSLKTFVGRLQQQHPLLMEEIEMLPPALKLAELEFILDRLEQALPDPEKALFVGAALHSLARLNEQEWPPLLEPMIAFDSILHQDPSGIFAAMDAETRHAYRKEIATLASRADFNEVETAAAAIEMAKQAQAAGDADPRTDPRTAARMQHVGYFLLAEGLPALKHRISYHPRWQERARDALLRWNKEFYLNGITLLTILLIVPITAPLVPHHEFWPTMLTLLLALLPITQGAVDMMNGLVQSLLKAQALPKLDYAKAVPETATTLVVVPTLLIAREQVRQLFDDLEARYLANEDPNIHFALLTDLPDSKVRPQPDEDDELVKLAVQLTEQVNATYLRGKGGKFFLLHRHRVFNRRQGAWMGWERKRGKLLDLNKLLLKEYDSFPIKAGPLHLLDNICYVITLDSDTKLPHATARRMIGTIHHPLNRALINPRLGIVTAGYGILQPRVAVSVASASRSRLAAIYSGETGLDVYTRAVSDVYQDLFGEGIFTGKGIYDVEILNRVLGRRFPRNALLSHDLIEGAYVRAGLVSDVEVIDDYPSQYHAHARREHRWIRGDWQILRWLFARVPDESGKPVRNPISVISKWKILDNLRRSLVEPVTLLILVCGWFFLPGGALYWTLVTIGLLLLPSLVQLCFDLIRALARANLLAVSESLTTFSGSLGVSFLNLTFLAHQVMLSLDAIVRSITRSYFSGRHLLEWETAAQAESGSRRTALDTYLQLSPFVAIVLALSLALTHPHRLIAAGPILFLWLIAPGMASWLNWPPTNDERELSADDRWFLEDQALRIWRFYADFGGAENHWLVPDHVEEKHWNQVKLLTPTNLGMLLNARLAACELGFVTLPELAHATLGSLASYEQLEKHRGHIFNWYDLVTLRAIHPVVVSTVDSGNLAAALYTLRAGALDLLTRPLLTAENVAACDLRAGSLRESVRLAAVPAGVPPMTPPGTPYLRWIGDERLRRRAALRTTVEMYLPWLLPQYAALEEACPQMTATPPSCAQAEAFFAVLERELQQVDVRSSLRAAADELLERLHASRVCVRRLADDLKQISALAERFAEEMDFGFLFVESRQLLSNGFDVAEQQLHKPCFDLLATEARTAAFLAVAKGEIPQQSWFRLDRSHTLVKGRPVLLSWTATMFEHLMPTLWMRSYPSTMLANSLESVIQVQQDHTGRLPWGISESGFIGEDESAKYAYKAWGIPAIALKYTAEDGPVISPYSTFLALPLAPKAALANLRRMAQMGWTGEYGFYEAADYIGRTEQAPRLVRSWMAHHQGMSLLAITNVLRRNIFQTWFHANPRVYAAEQLLQEKPLSKEALSRLDREMDRPS